MVIWHKIWCNGNASDKSQSLFDLRERSKYKRTVARAYSRYNARKIRLIAFTDDWIRKSFIVFLLVLLLFALRRWCWWFAMQHEVYVHPPCAFSLMVCVSLDFVSHCAAASFLKCALKQQQNHDDQPHIPHSARYFDMNEQYWMQSANCEIVCIAHNRNVDDDDWNGWLVLRIGTEIRSWYVKVGVRLAMTRPDSGLCSSLCLHVRCFIFFFALFCFFECFLFNEMYKNSASEYQHLHSCSIQIANIAIIIRGWEKSCCTLVCSCHGAIKMQSPSQTL